MDNLYKTTVQLKYFFFVFGRSLIPSLEILGHSFLSYAVDIL